MIENFIHQVREADGQTTDEDLRKKLDTLIDGWAEGGDLLKILQTIARLQLASERDVFVNKLSGKTKITKTAINKDLKAILQENHPEPKTEIDQLEEANLFHPAMDFKGDTAIQGFRIRGAEDDSVLVLVGSPDGTVTGYIDPDSIIIDGIEYLPDRMADPTYANAVWSLDRMKKFLQNPTPPGGKALFEHIKGLLEMYNDFNDLRTYGFLAVWIIATYFSYGFQAFLFIFLFGPKESGKSQAFECLKYLVFCGQKLLAVSPAALGDTAEALRGVFLLDQAENLPPELVGLCADSYKKEGGKRRVVEMKKTGREILEFSTYCPKGFASRKILDFDLSDRCCQINTVRTEKPIPSFEGHEPHFIEARDMAHRFALTKWPAVRAAYLALAVSSGNRQRELFNPLKAVMVALELDEVTAKGIESFFMAGTNKTKHEPTEVELILFDALANRVMDASGLVEVTIDELIKDMTALTPPTSLTAFSDEGINYPSITKAPGTPKQVGSIISQYSLAVKDRRRNRVINGKKGKVKAYTFDPAHVLATIKKYSRADTEPQEATDQGAQGDT